MCSVECATTRKHCWHNLSQNGVPQLTRYFEWITHDQINNILNWWRRVKHSCTLIGVIVYRSKCTPRWHKFSSINRSAKTARLVSRELNLLLERSRYVRTSQLLWWEVSRSNTVPWVNMSNINIESSTAAVHKVNWLIVTYTHDDIATKEVKDYLIHCKPVLFYC